MKWYVITRKDAENLDTPILESGSDEALPVFTKLELAAKYIDDADWSSDYVVAELTPVACLEFLVAARNNGTAWGVINPNRGEHLSGEPQNVFSIFDCLGETAAWLQGRILRLDEGPVTPSELAKSAEEVSKHAKHTTPSTLAKAAEREA